MERKLVFAPLVLNAAQQVASFVVAASSLLATIALMAAAPLHAQTYSTIYSFSGTDGRSPTGVISDSRGDLFGTTHMGGTDENGTVFELASSGVQTVLFSFPGVSASTVPNGDLVRDADGNLYGTTTFAGSHKVGFVFKVNRVGETLLHTFAGGTDGSEPASGLISDSAGNLYGTTAYGGGKGNPGTIYRIDTSNTFTILHNFAGGKGGLRPEAALLLDAAGNLYGTTAMGGVASTECGNSGCGTVFRMNPANQLVVLHNFAGAPSDGAGPLQGKLLRDKNGNLYGVTVAGGTFDQGIVFKVDKTGVETVLYNFSGGADGGEPNSGLVLDRAGNLYGVTQAGGISTGCSNSGCGTLFKLNSSGVFSVIHTFTGDTSDGGVPEGNLIKDASGNIYGTAAGGGAGGSGTTFKLVP